MLDIDVCNGTVQDETRRERKEEMGKRGWTDDREESTEGKTTYGDGIFRI